MSEVKLTAANAAGAATGKRERNTVALLPCPFCGQPPEWGYVAEGEAKPEIEKAYWSLSCKGRPFQCTAHSMSFGDTKKECAENWNRRAPSRDAVLVNFVDEESHDNRTLRRYMRGFPQYAEALGELAKALNHKQYDCSKCGQKFTTIEETLIHKLDCAGKDLTAAGAGDAATEEEVRK